MSFIWLRDFRSCPDAVQGLRLLFASSGEGKALSICREHPLTAAGRPGLGWPRYRYRGPQTFPGSFSFPLNLTGAHGHLQESRPGWAALHDHSEMFLPFPAFASHRGGAGSADPADPAGAPAGGGGCNFLTQLLAEGRGLCRRPCSWGEAVLCPPPARTLRA